MQTLTEIRRLLDERGLTPKRSLGQNFLHDHNHIRRLVDASGVAPGGLVLEVGPGTGALTDWLLERGAIVVACELDEALADLLTDRLAEPIARDRLTLVRGDCLSDKHTLNPALTAALGDRPFRLVANLPYGAASPLMATLATDFHPALRSPAPCLGQFVTIQKEVAQRVRAAPGGKEFGELAIVVQAMAGVGRIATLPPGCFWPAPKVTSEMISIVPRQAPLTLRPDRLERLCRVLFTHRRKQLGGVLGAAGITIDLPPGVSPSQRPEQLTVEQLIALSDRAALFLDDPRCGRPAE
ncbi:MAG TPA: ribosomal RNA small subunit methyltransferase A [Phycisphaerales bacterium]|nr:ribosomal RNA small subunit methyltransferase A [Phycisphaerales bacterium]